MTMKRKLLVLAASATVAGGCASNDRLEQAQEREQVREYREKMEQAEQREQNEQMNSLIDKMPEWATNPPVATSGGAYGVGVGDAEEPAKAMRKAKLKAEYALAQQIRQELSGEERAQERQGSRDTDEYQLLIDRFVDAVPLQGHEIEDQEIIAHEGKARAYVLAYISGEALTKVAQDRRDTFVDETSSDAFQRLEKRLEKSDEAMKATE